MSTNSPTENTPARSSMTARQKKLLQAAALTAALVPLGSVTSEGATITCTFGSGAGCSSTAFGGGEGFFDEARTGFDSNLDGLFDYFLNLLFDEVNGDFEVEITDNQIDPATLNNSGKFALFSGVGCVPIAPQATGPPKCVEFSIIAPAPGPNTWTSSAPGITDPNDPGFVGFRVDLAWLLDTDSQFPSPLVLHDRGAPDVYDADITVPGSYYSGPPDTGCNLLYCGPFDPGISGIDNSFSNIVVGGQSVPEPVSMLLLGLGLGGSLYRQRRRASR